VCYDCLDAGIVVGGKRNTCPACGVLLGPNPYDHGKVKYDSTLDALAKKAGGGAPLKAAESRRKRGGGVVCWVCGRPARRGARRPGRARRGAGLFS
jgi:hypothetical protein